MSDIKLLILTAAIGLLVAEVLVWSVTLRTAREVSQCAIARYTPGAAPGYFRSF